MKRVMCIWFPNWSRQRVGNKRDRLRIADCGEDALPVGARLNGTIDTRQSAINNPHSAIQDLARWCGRFSPLVGLEESETPESLLLDVTGCSHLFGDEQGLAEQIVHDFLQRGLFVHLAIADTIGTAWAVAHYRVRDAECGVRNAECGVFRLAAPQREARPPSNPQSGHPQQRVIPNPQSAIVPPGGQSTALRPLPIEALRLPAKVVQRLHDLDLRRIGQLQQLPRAGLPSRFGTVVGRRLDQALGNVPELLTPERPPEPLEATWSSEYPIADRRAIETVVRRSIDQIVETLNSRHEGILQLLCRLGGPNHSAVRCAVGLVQPSHSPKHLFELVRMHLEQLSLPAEVSDVCLRATVTAPLESRPQEIFDSGANRDARQQLAVLVNRLSSRLSRHAVLRPCLYPDAQPEYACRYEPLVDGKEQATGNRQKTEERFATCYFSTADCRLPTANFFSRPLRLHHQPIAVAATSIVPDGPPIRFYWNNGDHTILHNWGPERIETGWWRHRPIRRDYYRVETTDGQRFWLFRQHPGGKWFLHGEFL